MDLLWTVEHIPLLINERAHCYSEGSKITEGQRDELVQVLTGCLAQSLGLHIRHLIYYSSDTGTLFHKAGT